MLEGPCGPVADPTSGVVADGVEGRVADCDTTGLGEVVVGRTGKLSPWLGVSTVDDPAASEPELERDDGLLVCDPAIGPAVPPVED
jgi:hypothetical protein